jgi:hypothetical protein
MRQSTGKRGPERKVQYQNSKSNSAKSAGTNYKEDKWERKKYESEVRYSNKEGHDAHTKE